MMQAWTTAAAIVSGIKERGEDGIGRSEYVRTIASSLGSVMITPGDYSILEHEATIYVVDGEVSWPNDLAGHVFASDAEGFSILGVADVIAPLLNEPFVAQTAWVELLRGDEEDVETITLGLALVARPYDIHNPHSHQR